MKTEQKEQASSLYEPIRRASQACIAPRNSAARSQWAPAPVSLAQLRCDFLNEETEQREQWPAHENNSYFATSAKPCVDRSTTGNIVQQASERAQRHRAGTQASARLRRGDRGLRPAAVGSRCATARQDGKRIILQTFPRHPGGDGKSPGA